MNRSQRDILDAAIELSDHLNRRLDMGVNVLSDDPAAVEWRDRARVLAAQLSTRIAVRRREYAKKWMEA